MPERSEGMSDLEQTGEEPAKPAPKAPPAASAAARARRIGGRVGPRPAPTDGDAATPAVELGKAAKADKPVAAVPSAANEPTASPADPDAPRPAVVIPGWLRWLPAGVLTAAAVIMAVLMIVFSHGVWWAKSSGNHVREEMLAAAKTCTVKTNTYKYTALPAYSAAVKQCTTGRLTGQINRTISTVIKKYAGPLKAVQTAQISRGAIESVSPHGKQWTVLVFGQLSVVNSNEPKGRTDPFAAEVTMEKVHGKWLMSGLQTVATPLS
jgi:O-acetyl-ADP-ribose deacetylase (regulator of RNase III)